LIILIRMNHDTVEVWNITRIGKRGGDLFLRKIDALKVSYVTTSLKIHAVKSYKQVHPKQNIRNTPGISARLTAVTLKELGDVSTVAKMLVEALNDVLQILDATGASIVV